MAAVVAVAVVEVEPVTAVAADAIDDEECDDARAEDDGAGGAGVDDAAVVGWGGLVPPWTSRVNRRTLRRIKEYLRKRRGGGWIRLEIALHF